MIYIKNFVMIIEEENPQTTCHKLFEDMIGNHMQFESPIEDENGNPTKKTLYTMISPQVEKA